MSSALQSTDRPDGASRPRGALLAVLIVIPMLAPFATLWAVRSDTQSIREPGSVTLVTVKVDGEEVPLANGGVSTVSYATRSVSHLEWLFLKRRAGVTTNVGAGSGAIDARPGYTLIRSGRDVRSFASVTDGAHQFEQAKAMAVVAALREADVPVELEGAGVVLPGNDLLASEVVVRADGRPVRTYFDWVGVVRKARPGSIVRAEFGSGGSADIRIPDAASSGWANYGPAGMQVNTLAPVVASQKVVDFLFLERGASGPSGGLAYALATYVAVDDPELVAGTDAVATGTVQPDGSVGVVAGIEPKTEAAIESGADVFYVPAALAEPARRTSAGRIRIVGVRTLRDAIDDIRARSTG